MLRLVRPFVPLVRQAALFPTSLPHSPVLPASITRRLAHTLRPQTQLQSTGLLWPGRRFSTTTESDEADPATQADPTTAKPKAKATRARSKKPKAAAAQVEEASPEGDSKPIVESDGAETQGLQFGGADFADFEAEQKVASPRRAKSTGKKVQKEESEDGELEGIDEEVDDGQGVGGDFEAKDQGDGVDGYGEDFNAQEEPNDLEELKKKLRAKKSTRTLPDNTLRNIGQTVKEKPWYVELAGPPMLSRVLNCISQENGNNIRIFHVADRCDYCDYLVVATGLSTSHLRAMSDSIVSMLRSRNEPLTYRGALISEASEIRLEGKDTDDWMAVDCGNVVVHLMSTAGREYYKIEEVWPECEIRSVTARAGAMEVWDDWDE